MMAGEKNEELLVAIIALLLNDRSRVTAK